MKANLWLKYLCAHLVIYFGTFGHQLSTEVPLDLVKFVSNPSSGRTYSRSTYKNSSVYIDIKRRSPPLNLFYTNPCI